MLTSFLRRKAADNASLPRSGPSLLVGLQWLALLLHFYTGCGETNAGGNIVFISASTELILDQMLVMKCFISIKASFLSPVLLALNS